MPFPEESNTKVLEMLLNTLLGWKSRMADAPVSLLKSAYKYFFHNVSITRQKKLGVLRL